MPTSNPFARPSERYGTSPIWQTLLLISPVAIFAAVMMVWLTGGGHTATSRRGSEALAQRDSRESLPAVNPLESQVEVCTPFMPAALGEAREENLLLKMGLPDPELPSALRSGYEIGTINCLGDNAHGVVRAVFVDFYNSSSGALAAVVLVSSPVSEAIDAADAESDAGETWTQYLRDMYGDSNLTYTQQEWGVIALDSSETPLPSQDNRAVGAATLWEAIKTGHAGT